MQSTQASLLGFYVLRNILRGILIAARPLEAATLLQSKSFLSTAVASYYTAAFHLSSATLAINGRIWFEDPLTHPEFSGHKTDCVVAKLTKTNTWKLERRSRSHANRWRELGQVYRESKGSIDHEFVRLVSRIVDYGPHSLGDDETIMAHGLLRVADLRHMALYQGFGFDEFAFDLADEGMSVVMDQRARAFRDLCLYLMRAALVGLSSIVSSVPAETLALIRGVLLLRVYSPPFEVSEAEGLDDAELSGALKSVTAWLLGEEPLAFPGLLNDSGARSPA